MAEALDTLARLRRLEAGEARRALGVAAAGAAAADQKLCEATARRQDELAASRVADAAAAALLSAWLPVADRQIADMRAQLAERRGEVQLAGAELSRRKAALEAVETLLEARGFARNRLATRRAQSRLDEFGQRAGRAPA